MIYVVIFIVIKNVCYFFVVTYFHKVPLFQEVKKKEYLL